jgi:hypothetical protein
MIKTKHGEFEIRPITFAERRELHRLEMEAFWDQSIDKNAYFNMLNWVMVHAFDDPEQALKNLDDGQIDEVLNEVYMHYKGLSKKKPSK